MVDKPKRPRQTRTSAPHAIIEQAASKAEADGLAASTVPEGSGTTSESSLQNDATGTSPNLIGKQRIDAEDDVTEEVQIISATNRTAEQQIGSGITDPPIFVGTTNYLQPKPSEMAISDVEREIRISDIAATELATRQLAEISSRLDFKLPFFGSVSFRHFRQVDPESASSSGGIGSAISHKVALRQEQISVLSELSKLGIDPKLFDSMLSNELDRNLKRQFGLLFLALTAIFTAIAYGVIVLAAAYRWNIPNSAITLLIAETPLQFIGLLYIIARNLFPQGNKMPESKLKDHVGRGASRQNQKRYD